MKSALESYAFLNAKLKTRISASLRNDAIDELVRAKSLPETLLLLRGTRFEAIESSYQATGDLKSGEALLCASEAGIFTELFRYSKEPIRSFFEALSLRFEIDKLKNLLRLWFDAATRSGDVIGKAAYIDRTPIVHKLDIDAVLAAVNEKDVLLALSKTPYEAVLARHLADAVSQASMFKLELALDRFYFDNAFAAASKLQAADRKIAERALAMDADAQNADRLVRFKTFFAMEADEAFSCLIPYGAATRAKGLKDAYRQEGSAELAKRVLGGTFGRIASFIGSAGDTKSGAGFMEKAFREIALDEARRFLGGNPFSIGVSLAYATLRREELRSVMTVLNAKYYGLAEERIRNAL